jgi:carbamoyltransferase
VLPAITHFDKTARLQTVSDKNTFFYQVCHSLASLKGVPPVIVNTSFNVAGQPIVETPEDAIVAFLSTDMDILCMDCYWITKRRQTDIPYADYVRDLPHVELPAGLPANQPSVDGLMRRLHEALVWQEMDNCPWDEAELRELSARGGKYLTGSELFSGAALSLPEQFIFLINPLGKTPVLSRWGKHVASLSFDELRILSTLTEANSDKLDKMRKQLRYAPRVWNATLSRLNAFVNASRQYTDHPPNQETVGDRELPYAVNKTLEPFGDPDFRLCDGLEPFYRLLKDNDYTESTICKLLRVECLQNIEVHHLAYYDRFTLAEGPLEDLIRLFLLRKKMPQHRAHNLFGNVYGLLTAIGLLKEQGDTVSSLVDIYCVEDLYIATDHRYMVYPDDHADQEQPVMYIGLDSHGLKNVMPRQPITRALDLCSGSGVQALTASLFVSHVIAMDINLRALRFSRFNAQLNGIENVEFRQGDVCNLSDSLDEFDLILANPPFVPAPTQSLRYRDGGAHGEDILRYIVAEAESHLVGDGILCVVSDLVNVNDYHAKLRQWWRGAAKCMVLMTADRNEIQFALPHCQRPFDQSYREFYDELAEWVSHFRAAELQAVNFGFILLQKKNSGDFAYFSKVIHTPTSPIYAEIWPHFDRLGDLMSVPVSAVLRLHPAVRLRCDISPGGNKRYAVTSEHQYFSEYEVPARIYQLLCLMLEEELTLSSIAEQDREILNVLHEKGIVTTSYQYANVLNTALDRGKLARIKKARIKEHATRTTPTCLSSYLKQ